MLLLGVLAGGMFLGGQIAGGGWSLFSRDDDVTSRSNVVVESVTRVEELVLLNLAMQGIEIREAESGEFGVFKMPGTERKSMLVWKFDAKLGLDGRKVTVVEKEESSFLVTIPEFTFIGHEVYPFESVIEQNGALSWMTEPIEDTDMVNSVLGSEKMREYLEQYDAQLQEQARTFYTKLVFSIEPEAVLEFKFQESKDL